MKHPTQEQIQRRAYEIYVKHGKPGRDAENWSQAERELTEIIERDEKEATVWEDTSSRRDPNAVVATARSSKPREFKKGF
jgi:hypothetical protein